MAFHFKFNCSAALYYGAQTRRPAVMMVWMVLTMIGIVLAVICILALIVLAAIQDTQTVKIKMWRFASSQWFVLFQIDNILIEFGLQGTISSSDVVTIMVVSIVIISIASVVEIYFWAVVYSFYKEIKESSSDPNRYLETGSSKMRYEY